MDKFKVTGPTTLTGHVEVSRSKNACLPILAATILFPQDIILHDLPKINDVINFIKLLENIGAEITFNSKTCRISTRNITNVDTNKIIASKFRASILILGPSLSRLRAAKVAFPGGCNIGERPIDWHIAAMKLMGADAEIGNDHVLMATKGLKGTKIKLPFPSVGVTENLMMAAVYANGKTVIENASSEPDVMNLIHFLQQFGCNIHVYEPSIIIVKGSSFGTIKADEEFNFRDIIGDRMEAATFIIAGIITNSRIKVSGFNPASIEEILKIITEIGGRLFIGDDYIEVHCHNGLRGVRISTAPYPGLPTDIQAPMSVLLGVSDGISSLTETVFENRLKQIPELMKLGIQAKVSGKTVYFEGNAKLKPGTVISTDLRACASLVLSGLIADGTTEIENAHHIDRGYEGFCEKLKNLGANIERIQM